MGRISQGAATARGGIDHGIEFLFSEGFKKFAHVACGCIFHAQVMGQGTAAALDGGNGKAAPMKQAQGGGVDLRGEDLLDASRKQGNVATGLFDVKGMPAVYGAGGWYVCGKGLYGRA